MSHTQPPAPPPHNPQMLSSRAALQFLSLHRCTGLPHLKCRHLGFIQANDKAGNKSESSEGQHSYCHTQQVAQQPQPQLLLLEF